MSHKLLLVLSAAAAATVVISCSSINSPVSIPTTADECVVTEVVAQETATADESAGEVGLAKTTANGVSQFSVVDYDKNSGKLFIRAYHDKGTPAASHGHIYLYKIYGKTSESDAEKMAKNFNPWGPAKQKGRDGKWIEQLNNVHIYTGMTDNKKRVYCVSLYDSRTKQTYNCLNASTLEQGVKSGLKYLLRGAFFEKILAGAMRLRFGIPIIVPTGLMCYFGQCSM